jgi:hypothetical protein
MKQIQLNILIWIENSWAEYRIYDILILYSNVMASPTAQPD